MARRNLSPEGDELRRALEELLASSEQQLRQIEGFAFAYVVSDPASGAKNADFDCDVVMLDVDFRDWDVIDEHAVKQVLGDVPFVCTAPDPPDVDMDDETTARWEELNEIAKSLRQQVLAVEGTKWVEPTGWSEYRRSRRKPEDLRPTDLKLWVYFRDVESMARAQPALQSIFGELPFDSEVEEELGPGLQEMALADIVRRAKRY